VYACGHLTHFTVIAHINHIAPSKKKAAGASPVSQLAGLVNGAMLSMVEDGVLDARLAPSLRVHLDWIQYKTNFREPVMVRRPADRDGRALPLAEIAVRSLAQPPEASPQQRVFLGGFTPYRDCLILSGPGETRRPFSTPPSGREDREPRTKNQEPGTKDQGPA
jgi:hypothetical protein